MSHFLALDIETTGPNVLRHPMVAFGAVLVRVADAKVPDADCRFRAIMNTGTWPFGVFEQRCYDEFWSKKDDAGTTPFTRLRDLAARAGTVTAPAAARGFVEWAQRMFSRFPDTVIVTDTAAYDTTWMNVMLAKHTPEKASSLLYLSGAYRPVRDVSSFHLGVGEQTPARGLWGAETAALVALGVGDFPEVIVAVPHDHDPLHDAEYIGKTAAFIAQRLDARHHERKQRRCRDDDDDSDSECEHGISGYECAPCQVPKPQ